FLGLAEISFIVPCTKDKSPQQDPSLNFFSEALRPGFLVEFRKSGLRVSCAVTISNPIKSGKVGRGFCRGQYIIGWNDKIKQVKGDFFYIMSLLPKLSQEIRQF